MYGKPTISSEIGTGTTYLNIDGDTGLVVPPSDALALRTAMRKLWDNPELARTMGRRAATRFEELFTSEQMAANYTALYHDLVARRAARPERRRPRTNRRGFVSDESLRRRIADESLRRRIIPRSATPIASQAILPDPIDSPTQIDSAKLLKNN